MSATSTSTSQGPNLRDLRDRPFELLRELERRGRAIAGGRQDAVGREWVGVAFRLGAETFLVAREETREVMALPSFLTRVPGARPWIRGLANVRGQLLPVIDLRQYLGSGTTQASRNVRVIVVNHRPATSSIRFRIPSPTRTAAAESAELAAYGLATISRGRFCTGRVGRLERSCAATGVTATAANSSERVGRTTSMYHGLQVSAFSAAEAPLTMAG